MSTHIEGRYFGQSKPLFALYLKTTFLTLVTLGIYRFWAKTRIRKYIWSASSADGDSFEYTGTGLEKFLGFLVAIVILAVYLGIVQMVLFYFGLNLFSDPSSEAEMLAQIGAIYITFFAVLPLLLFAQYRARRYRLARTRWRGLRFGMENGAWGYAFRALGYYLLVMLTLGILTPLATFRLEKYMADRTWYGDAKFVQNGRWQTLYRGMKHLLIGLMFMIALPALLGSLGSPVLAIVSLIIGYIWFLIGAVYYRIYAFNYLTSQKVLDGKVGLASEAQTSKVVMIAVVGSIVVGVVGGMIFGLAAGILATTAESIVVGSSGIGVMIAIALLYIIALLIIGGLSLVMITQPIIEHVVNNVTAIDETDHLTTIRQRAADTGADAEGFADALDVGGAI